jgi:hypothetical protein
MTWTSSFWISVDILQLCNFLCMVGLRNPSVLSLIEAYLVGEGNIRRGIPLIICLVSKLVSNSSRCFSYLKGVWHEILTSGFFHKSVSPRPLSITWGSFQIFSKIRGDNREWMFISCVTAINRSAVSLKPLTNLSPVSKPLCKYSITK